MAGGGVHGVVKALWIWPDRKISVISAEISERTPTHLIEEVVDVALSHEFTKVASLAVLGMEVRGSMALAKPSIQTVPMKIALRENTSNKSFANQTDYPTAPNTAPTQSFEISPRDGRPWRVYDEINRFVNIALTARRRKAGRNSPIPN